VRPSIDYFSLVCDKKRAPRNRPFIYEIGHDFVKVWAESQESPWFGGLYKGNFNREKTIGLKQALNGYQKAYESVPGDEYLMYRMADCFLQLQDYDMAKLYSARLLAEKPDSRYAEPVYEILYEARKHLHYGQNN